jgi:hypothetical protein
MGLVVDKNVGGGGGGGDATAANQALQILQLEDASTANNVFKNTAQESVFKDQFENSVFVDRNNYSVFRDFAGNSVLQKPVQIESTTVILLIQGATTIALIADLQTQLSFKNGWYLVSWNYNYNPTALQYEGILILNTYI